MQIWLKCIRFDFAREIVVGDAWADTVKRYDGTECSAGPTGAGLFEAQICRAVFEGFMPCLVAMAYSWGITGP
jgi:hypothetical protein